MRIPLPKLKAVLLYFATHTDTKYLGKVKLMKLFYFLDFIHLKTYGAPVTYDSYVKLEHGPIPSFIKNLIDDAADDIDHSVLADTIHFERPTATKMFRILPKRVFSKKDRDYFSETEFEILKKVCVTYGNDKTEAVEEASHKESAWSKTSFLDKIPYSLAAQDPDSKVSKEEIELLLQIS